MQHTFLNEFDVVIAYSRRDLKYTARLADDLAAVGLRAWTGDYLKPESDYWQSSVEQALAVAKRLIVIISPRSMLSRSVRAAVRYCLLNDLPIYPLVVMGEPADVMPPNVVAFPYVDGRDAAEHDESLALPELLALIHADQDKQPPFLAACNPVDQWRLLRWLLATPQRITEFQKQAGILPLKRTANWLSVMLVFALYGLDVLLEWFHDPSVLMVLTLGLLIGLGFQTAVRETAGMRWASYRWSAIGAVATISTALPLLLWIQPSSIAALGHPAIGDWLFVGGSVLVGGLALGITETFQVRSILVPVVTMFNMATAAASTIATLASDLTHSINNEFGTIVALTLISALVGALVISVQYATSFLIANDFVRAIYLQAHPSRLRKLILTMLPTPYLLVILRAIVG